MTEALIALLALSAMEIVLGIDNIVFITILTGRLPEKQRPKARTLGLAVALVSRLVLLFSLTLILQATSPLFHLTSLGIPESWIEAAVVTGHGHGESGEVSEEQASHAGVDPKASRALPDAAMAKAVEEINGVSVRDLILLLGGLFLVGKSVHEIHHKMEGHESEHKAGKHPSFASVITQIAIIDIVFSLDSVITAVGMAKELWVMVTAVVLAVGVMMAFAGKVSAFVEKHPTIKILAMSFLILIGVMLVSEGLGAHVNKGYIYFAMAFALVVEFVNIRVQTRSRLQAVSGDARA